jgi:hypothetical protein
LPYLFDNHGHDTGHNQQQDQTAAGDPDRSVVPCFRIIGAGANSALDEAEKTKEAEDGRYEAMILPRANGEIGGPRSGDDSGRRCVRLVIVISESLLVPQHPLPVALVA